MGHVVLHVLLHLEGILVYLIEYAINPLFQLHRLTVQYLAMLLFITTWNTNDMKKYNITYA